MPSSKSVTARGFAIGTLAVSAVVVVALVAGVASGPPAAIETARAWLGLLVGTLLCCAIAIAVAAPVGLLAAIHLSEFASPRVRRGLSAALELVTLVPTVVWGWFALVVMTPSLRALVPSLAAHNALSAGLVLGVMATPMVAAEATRALDAVPRRLREGALALGAGEAQTILTIVIPAAAPGIAAAILLALSRALGETMIVTLAAGHRPIVTLDPRVPVETLGAHIIDATRSGADHRGLFLVGLGLLALAVVSSLSARRVARWRSEDPWQEAEAWK